MKRGPLTALAALCATCGAAELLNGTGVSGLTDGVNLQPSWFNGGKVHFGWSLMKQFNLIGTVRIAIEHDKAAAAVSWIQEANAHGLKVIAVYDNWPISGSSDPSELTKAAQWWLDNYQALDAAGPFVINLSNEWGGKSISASDFASAYNSAIQMVRKVYSGPIVVDCPGWAQESGTCAQAVIGSGVKIGDPNIILSLHIYKQITVGGLPFQPSNLNDLVATGRPCIIGEFGTGSSGLTDWHAVVLAAKRLGWPVIGWAWNGDGGNMNMVSPSWSQDPTATAFVPNNYFMTVYSTLMGQMDVPASNETLVV